MTDPQAPDSDNSDQNVDQSSVKSSVNAMKNELENDPARRPDWERETLEKLAFAALNEQKANRRWRIFNRLFWLALAGTAVWLAFWRVDPASHGTFDHTAVVEIRGEIDKGSDASAENVISAMSQALEDKGSRALVLLINSPGGSPVQAGMINDEILRLKKLHGKPVYAVVEDACASAAYYIAAGTDRIYVDKASIVGSIGVLMDGFGFTGLMDKLGVERRLMTAGANKGFLDPFSPQTESQRVFAQTMLDQIHAQFIAVVRSGRGDRLKETPETFSGLFWTGQQAVAMGLADGFGSLDSVAREVVKVTDIVDYTRRENVAEKLAKRFGAAVGEGAVRAMRVAPVLR